MRKYSPTRESYELILILMLVGVLIRVFALAPFEATSVSMAPQILPGDYILATRLTFGLPVPFQERKIGGAHLGVERWLFLKVQNLNRYAT